MRQAGRGGGRLGRASVARQFHAIEGVAAEPAVHQVARHPGAPAQLQQLGQVEAVDGDDDEDHGQVGEAPQLCQKHRLVLVLQRVEEDPVPFVQQHQHVHRAQIERDDGRQQAARLPLLVGGVEIGRGEVPDLAQEQLEAGKFVGPGHAGLSFHAMEEGGMLAPMPFVDVRRTPACGQKQRGVEAGCFQRVVAGAADSLRAEVLACCFSCRSRWRCRSARRRSATVRISCSVR